jgi:hypothetical protein
MDRAEWNRQLKSNKKRMHMSGRTELARGIDHHIRCEKQFQCIPEDTIVALCHPIFDSLEEQSLYIAAGLPSVPQREHNCPMAGRSGNTVLSFRHATARAVTRSNGMSDQGSKIFTRQEANGNDA